MDDFEIYLAEDNADFLLDAAGSSAGVGGAVCEPDGDVTFFEEGETAASITEEIDLEVPETSVPAPAIGSQDVHGFEEIEVDEEMTEHVAFASPPSADAAAGAAPVAEAPWWAEHSDLVDGLNMESLAELEAQPFEGTLAAAAPSPAVPMLVPDATQTSVARADGRCPLWRRYLASHPQALRAEDANCEAADSNDTAEAPCWVCGRFGHDGGACPQKGCFLCAASGHGSSACPKRQLKCSHCSLRGHLGSSCPTQAAQELSLPLEGLRCLRCGRNGHANCPKPRASVVSQPSRRNVGLQAGAAAQTSGSAAAPARTFSKASGGWPSPPPMSPPPSPDPAIDMRFPRVPAPKKQVFSPAPRPLMGQAPKASPQKLMKAAPKYAPKTQPSSASSATPKAAAQGITRRQSDAELLGATKLQRPTSGFSSAASRSIGAMTPATSACLQDGVGADGYLFLCTSRTMKECTALQLLGSPLRELGQMTRHIGPTTQLFLYNMETQKFIGPLIAVDEPGKDLEPQAFARRFNAQVRARAAGALLLEGKLHARPKPGPKTAADVAELTALLEAGDPAEPALDQAWRGSEEDAGDAELEVEPCFEDCDAEPAAKRQRCESVDAVQPDDLSEWFAASPSDGSDGEAYGGSWVGSGADGVACQPLESPADNGEHGQARGDNRATAADVAAGPGGAGYVFLCNNSTQRDCERLRLLGSPERELEQMVACISKDTRLFLLNRESGNLVGTFLADEPPQHSIMPRAFGGKFTAQVRVSPAEGVIREAKTSWRVTQGPKAVGESRALEQFLQQSGKAVNAARSPWAASPGQDSAGGSEVDADGRAYDFSSVVVNFANVGATYAEKVLRRDKERGERMFDWEGVRRCVQCLKGELGLRIVGVVFENLRGPDSGTSRGTNADASSLPLPLDIRRECATIEETPRVTGRNHRSADDEMTIKLAYRRNCRFMDNDNYRDWLTEMRNQKIRNWLQSRQELLQMRYFFDSELGAFDTLDGNIAPELLAPGQ